MNTKNFTAFSYASKFLLMIEVSGNELNSDDNFGATIEPSDIGFVHVNTPSLAVLTHTL